MSSCLSVSAAKGDEAAYQTLIDTFTINLRYGHWTTYGCHHEPPCVPATDEQMAVLQKRVDEHFEKNPVKREKVFSGPRGYCLTPKMIRRHAYSLWEKQGGEENDNWLQAEKELHQMGAEGTLAYTCPDCNKDHCSCACS